MAWGCSKSDPKRTSAMGQGESLKRERVYKGLEANKHSRRVTGRSNSQPKDTDYFLQPKTEKQRNTAREPLKKSSNELARKSCLKHMPRRRVKRPRTEAAVTT